MSPPEPPDLDKVPPSGPGRREAQLESAVGGQEKPYDPSRHREWVRSILAYLLASLLIVQNLYALTLFVWLFSSGRGTISDIKDLLTVLYPPTVGLVGAATGFYFAQAVDRH